MERLKRDRMMFVSEIETMGEKYGLSRFHIQRILKNGETIGVGFTAEAFVYLNNSRVSTSVDDRDLR